MLRNILIGLLMIVLMGIIGHYDFENEVMTHKQDEINKQEVIKDLQMRCYKGIITDESICKGF